MNIVIVGGGKIGFSIAQELALENHDVIVVEKRNPVSTLITLSKLPSGKEFIDGKIVKHFSGKHVVIETNQPLIDIDGELFENKKFDAKIAPNSINLIL